jgi:hypothetical protein
MLIKAGVDISRLKREIRRALPKIENVYKSYGYELVITSTYEGNHGAGSLHYADQAVDTARVKEFLGNVVNDIREGLGPDYDVVSEGDHIHIEYDPK